MQNLVSLPEANELPIVYALRTGTNTCRTRLPLPVTQAHPSARVQETERTYAQKSELLLSEQSCQSCFSEIKQVNPAEH